MLKYPKNYAPTYAFFFFSPNPIPYSCIYSAEKRFTVRLKTLTGNIAILRFVIDLQFFSCCIFPFPLTTHISTAFFPVPNREPAQRKEGM